MFLPLHCPLTADLLAGSLLFIHLRGHIDELLSLLLLLGYVVSPLPSTPYKGGSKDIFRKFYKGGGGTLEKGDFQPTLVETMGYIICCMLYVGFIYFFIKYTP